MLSQEKYDALQIKYSKFEELNSKAGFPVLDDMYLPVISASTKSKYEQLDRELDDCIRYAQERLDGIHEREYQKQLKEKKLEPEKEESNIKINIVSHIGDNTGIFFQRLPSKEIMDAYHERQKNRK